MSKMKDTQITITKTLGYPGVMISGSKSGYMDRNPGNLVIFNANVCTKELGKIWFGDLDLTKSKDKLWELAKQLNQNVYVLYEMDGRFEHEEKPLMKKAVVVFTKDSYKIREDLKKYYSSSLLRVG